MLEKSWSNSRSKEAGKTRHISNGTLGYHGDIYGSRRYLTESDDVIDFNDVTVLQRQPSSSRRNTLCTKLAGIHSGSTTISISILKMRVGQCNMR